MTVGFHVGGRLRASGLTADPVLPKVAFSQGIQTRRIGPLMICLESRQEDRKASAVSPLEARSTHQEDEEATPEGVGAMIALLGATLSAAGQSAARRLMTDDPRR